MLKLQRNYYAEFQIKEQDKDGNWKETEVVTISYPITLNFEINLGAYKAANSGIFQFYNLSPQDAAKLWIDIYNIGKKQIHLTLYAGYNNTMPMVFYGRVQQCLSYRAEGSTEWITEVQAFEGGKLFKYGFISATFTKTTSFDDVVNFMLEDDPETKIGCVTPDIPPLPRNRTFIGQTMDLLGREYGGYEIFIEKGKLHILGDNDVLDGEILVITDKSGLLGTPRRANCYVEIDMVFEPQLRTGQAVELLCNSNIMQSFNRAYKVVAIKHTGTISDRVSGTLKTHLTLFAPNGKLRKVEQVKPKTYNPKVTDTKWSKPVKSGRISSAFGLRKSPTKGASTNHKGMDIAANKGTPIYAPANGVIPCAPCWNGGYGNFVQINHGTIDGKKVVSRYGHLDKWAVESGQTVYKNQTIIGYVGMTGTATGYHLHFEVRENNNPVNPTKYIGNY